MLYEALRLDYSYPHPILIVATFPFLLLLLYGSMPSMATARRFSTSHLLLVGNSGLFSSEEFDVGAGVLFLNRNISL